MDPRCAHLDLAHGQARARRLDHVLSNSFAFGGSNVSLVFSRVMDPA
jgi:3-oxoacyl-(acyl-carrier-protein) synthase